jgi:hypothetical protein
MRLVLAELANPAYSFRTQMGLPEPRIWRGNPSSISWRSYAGSIPKAIPVWQGTVSDKRSSPGIAQTRLD